MFAKLVNFILAKKLHKFENKIGYTLHFKNIPDRFINGIVEWDMTNAFKKFGINIEEGSDYWTMGNIVKGISSRFDRNAPEYQSWLGGYLVKLTTKQEWTVQDHFKLAIADQNSWLHTYGDPNPMTTIEGCEFTKVGVINAGSYSGTLYEGGCITHSDVGSGSRSLKLNLESDVIADLFNLSNPKLNIKGSMLRPPLLNTGNETLKLHGYIGIFDVEENIKVVLYGNGAVVDQTDTFDIIKYDLLKAMQSCEIVKIFK